MKEILKKQIREYYQKYDLTFKNDDFKGYFRGNNTIYGIMGKDNKYSRFLFWDNGNKMSPVPLNSIRKQRRTT